jgi:uncharacterized protein (DUF1330 family)
MKCIAKSPDHDNSSVMPVYLIAQLTIYNRTVYSEYEVGFMDILSKYEGKLLSVDESPEVIEGTWDHTRTVLLEFASVSTAKRWYDSVEYQKLAQHRLAGSSANLVLIKGQ